MMILEGETSNEDLTKKGESEKKRRLLEKGKDGRI